VLSDPERSRRAKQAIPDLAVGDCFAKTARNDITKILQEGDTKA